MNLKSCFLTLSMKEQLCITLIALNCFCILVILSICGSLAFEILKEDYRQKKLYFFEKYQNYIETCFHFQNFYLLQYEELIKRIQKQIWEHQQVSSIYNFEYNFKKEANILSNIDISSYYSKDKQNLNNDDSSFPLYFTCFYNSPSECLDMKNKLLSQYKSFSSAIFSPNKRDLFRIPILDHDTMSTPLFYNVNTYTIFCFNYLNMIQKIIEICGSEFSLSKIFRYYDTFTNKTKYDINDKLKLFMNTKPPLVEHMFENILKEINEVFPYKNLKSYLDKAMSVSGYFPYIDYPNDKFYFINNIEELYYYYYIESNIINNYFYFMNKKISSLIDMYFIPLYFENNTIISPELCVFFLLKQNEYQKEENEIDNLIKKIIKGKTKIDECLITDKNLIDKRGIKDILNLNTNSFLIIKNFTISHGILYLNNSLYYFLKYSYPNYNTLKDFKTDYFSLEQTNYYLFASFKDPIKFTSLCYQNSLKCFFIIIIIIVYVWILCLFINLCIFSKVIIQLTQPIKKLQEAVESSSMTENENIFTYEYDEIINELFSTCKELLTGEKDNSKNEKKIGDFNVLSIPKDKEKIIDKNRYMKNLIINNDIINKLISEQENMMDFSKFIELNDFNYESNINKSEKIYKKNIIKKPTLDLSDINDINDINGVIKENKNNEEKEKEDREPYKKLFKIAEYFNYYLEKHEENYINIINNNITEDNKSQISKISRLNSNNRKNSIRITPKNSKNLVKSESNFINDDNEKITINMINNKNISYLWYMEAKKKKNKSLNYKIGNNFEELFSEYIT